ncbi:hypothetical protein DIJ64_13690 [Mycobacterium leprae]|uniref:Uncharacterized protein n=1 Tax=Mycobacterium leprae TaxID=1769 RepID=A0AAD0P9N2_MYCLR|nr:hypothetical protein DIJ64_13690 [Mycobacterium leprae]
MRYQVADRTPWFRRVTCTFGRNRVTLMLVIRSITWMHRGVMMKRTNLAAAGLCIDGAKMVLYTTHLTYPTGGYPVR